MFSYKCSPFNLLAFLLASGDTTNKFIIFSIRGRTWSQPACLPFLPRNIFKHVCLCCLSQHMQGFAFQQNSSSIMGTRSTILKSKQQLLFRRACIAMKGLICPSQRGHQTILVVVCCVSRQLYTQDFLQNGSSVVIVEARNSFLA